jgi:hypothetical protein
MTAMEFHPLSGIFPLLDGSPFHELADDIRRRES